MTDKPELELSRFAPYRFAVLGRLMSQALAAAYRGEGLSIPEWRVLAVVSQRPAMAARDVVRQTPMDKMAVSRAVSSLERKGLLARRKAQDRRVAELELTESGRDLFARIARIARDYEHGVFGALAPGEREILFSLLDRLEMRAQEIGGEPAP
jgi:DNA-binding MarR family transcriptional regulator